MNGLRKMFPGWSCEKIDGLVWERVVKIRFA